MSKMLEQRSIIIVIQLLNKSEMSTSVHDLIDFSKLDLVPYQSPISPKHFSRLAFNTLFVAFVIMAWFIM